MSYDFDPIRVFQLLYPNDRPTVPHRLLEGMDALPVWNTTTFECG
jgi:hypothetical protein